MKVAIILEDTTKGVFPKVVWQGNGVTDHEADSLSMLLAAQFVDLLKQHAKLGAVKVVSEPNTLH